MVADEEAQRVADRVLVAGVTGSGKTTLARRIADEWGLRHVEIDSLYHGPGWTPRPSFLEDVRAFAAQDRWVTEWQYTSKGTEGTLAPRAQLVLWLAYPYRVVRSRLIRRTVARHMFRTELWNGNTERGITSKLSRDPEANILRWQTKTLRKLGRPDAWARAEVSASGDRAATASA